MTTPDLPISSFLVHSAPNVKEPRLIGLSGHHSIGLNTTWSLIELNKHLECLEQLVAEINSVDITDIRVGQFYDAGKKILESHSDRRYVVRWLAHADGSLPANGSIGRVLNKDDVRSGNAPRRVPFWELGLGLGLVDIPRSMSLTLVLAGDRKSVV